MNVISKERIRAEYHHHCVHESHEQAVQWTAAKLGLCVELVRRVLDEAGK